MEENSVGQSIRMFLAAIVALVVVVGAFLAFKGKSDENGNPDNPENGVSVGSGTFSEEDVAAAGTRLVAAVRAGDITSAAAFLDEGDNPNEPGIDGSTALNTALAFNNSEMAQLLLNRGADPNVPALDGYFPIHRAVVNGDVGVVAQIAQSGVDLNSRVQTTGQTALMLAAAGNRIEMISVLAGWNADATLTDSAGDNALHIALLNGASNPEVYSFLIQAGADPNALGSQGKSAIELATEAGLTDVLAALQG